MTPKGRGRQSRWPRSPIILAQNRNPAGGGKYGAAARQARANWPPALVNAWSALLLVLDVLDDLGHVVLVLAELRGILDELLFFLLGLALGRGFLALDCFGLLDLAF